MNYVRNFQLCKLNCFERVKKKIFKKYSAVHGYKDYLSENNNMSLYLFFRPRKLLILARRIKDSFSLRRYLIRNRSMLLTTLQFEK